MRHQNGLWHCPCTEIHCMQVMPACHMHIWSLLSPAGSVQHYYNAVYVGYMPFLLPTHWCTATSTCKTVHNIRMQQCLVLLSSRKGRIWLTFFITFSAQHLLAPTSTADCKRGFLAHNRIKTSLNNWLTHKISIVYLKDLHTKLMMQLVTYGHLKVYTS